MNVSRKSSTPFLMFLAGWLAAAVVAGATGRVERLLPPVPQVIILGLTLGLVLATVLHRGLREWAAQVSLRGFVAFHLTRFVGIVFLVLQADGKLPREFAVSAGWGDIIAAVGALGIVLFQAKPESRPWVLMLWNAYGLADILSVVFTATRIALTQPVALIELLRFPLSLVPTFVVPMLIASHVLIFWRLRALSRRS